MSVGKRPGGLTALAIVNFVWGAISALVLLLGLLAVVFLWTGDAGGGQIAEIARQTREKMEEHGISLVAYTVIVCWGAVTLPLMLIAGVGYLNQSNIWGRLMGNLYALSSIGQSVAGIFVLSAMGFGLGHIIEIILPVVTFVLINTTFAEDFE